MHEVVKLLLARMASHPEEFLSRENATDDIVGERWWKARSAVDTHGTAEERAALGDALRKIRLNNAHEWMMDELLNGERRRQQEKLERQAKVSQVALAQSVQQSNMYANQTQSILGSGPIQSVTSVQQSTNQGLIERLRAKGWV